MNSEWLVMDWMKFSKDGRPIDRLKVVLKAAQDIGRDKEVMGLQPAFTAHEIQKRLFPDAAGFQAKASGISDAIQRLKRKGLIENAPWHHPTAYRMKRRKHAE